MKFKLVFALFPLILLGTPLYAQIDQSLCLQCLTDSERGVEERASMRPLAKKIRSLVQEKTGSTKRRPAKRVSAKLKGRRKVGIKVKAFQ